MNLQPINASASPEAQINENFETLDCFSVYGKDPRTTENLTWVYYGGRWSGFSITGGIANAITLTDDDDNYLVVAKATGVLSASNSSTNWDDTNNYARVYKITAASGVVTATEDHRGGLYGIFSTLTAIHGLFRKDDPTTVAFVKTGAFTISTQAAIIYIEVNGVIHSISASTAITMPGSPAAGTDYAIWAKTDGTLEATSDFVTPPATNARKIGGFHYAPGGNASQLSKTAVAAGTAIGAQTVTADKWALYLLSVNAAGTITVTPAAGNVAGYASEALAIAAMPTMPASSALMGYITVKTMVGTAWIAGTDALAGGTSGNPASTTNYYPSTGSALGLTLSRGSTDTNIASTAFSYYLGGDTTPAINPYSIWDLKFRPACPDPRGMCLVADAFWSDIYLLGVDHPTNGSSKYNVTIADGSNPPKIPAKFGGNGTTAYPGGNWWDMYEVLLSFGKRFPSYSEFSALAYGTTENASSTAATDPVSTILRAESTSKWGAMLSSGNMWVWGDEFGGGTAAAAWVANSGGRGSTYQLEGTVLFGGDWDAGARAGSRASYWGPVPSVSNISFGARGVADHYQAD